MHFPFCKLPSHNLCPSFHRISCLFLVNLPWFCHTVTVLFICYHLAMEMEKAMAPHSSTLAWKIPWAEEPDRLKSMGSLGVGHDWVTSLSLFTFMHWRRKWQPTPVFLPGESQGRGTRWAPIYGVAQSQTRLKWLNNLVAAVEKSSFPPFFSFPVF